MKLKINDVVMTPDGKGIIKKMEELYLGDIGCTCLLEKPYKIIDEIQATKEYGYPEYSFGYMYNSKKLKKV